MIKSEIFLTCIHNRHTDDKYLAFTSLDAAMQYVRDNFIGVGIEETTAMYGDWCLYVSDDYYAFVESVPLVYGG